MVTTTQTLTTTSNCKIFARQISPELQHSPLEFEDINNLKGTWLEGIVIAGNHDFKEIIGLDEYSNYLNCAGDISYEYKNFEEDINNNKHDTSYSTIREIIDDYIETNRHLTNKEIKRFCVCCDDYQLTYWDDRERECICEALSILTGEDYNYTQITGCCQSDWNYIFYPVKRKDEVHIIEIEYFNTGSEYELFCVDNPDDWDKDIDEIEDLYCGDGCVYVHEWNDTEIKKEITSNYGSNYTFEDVVLFNYT